MAENNKKGIYNGNQAFKDFKERRSDPLSLLGGGQQTPGSSFVENNALLLHRNAKVFQGQKAMPSQSKPPLSSKRLSVEVNNKLRQESYGQGANSKMTDLELGVEKVIQ